MNTRYQIVATDLSDETASEAGVETVALTAAPGGKGCAEAVVVVPGTAVAVVGSELSM